MNIVLLLLADLVVPFYIVWSDLNGKFESVGAFAILPLAIIGIVVHLVAIFFLRRTSYRYLTQTRSWNGTNANIVIFAVILLLTLFLIALPGYAVKSIAPSYDSHVQSAAINDLKQLESLYMEPVYLPPQVKFTEKRSIEESWSADGYVRLLTTYVCPELNQSTFGNISIALSPFTRKYNIQDPETVIVSGKEAIFLGNSHLILYDGNVTREVFRSGECGVTKDDLVKIMSSLQPAQFISGTQQNYGPAYHVFDAKY